jgi:hypothetical protein
MFVAIIVDSFGAAKDALESDVSWSAEDMNITSIFVEAVEEMLLHDFLFRIPKIGGIMLGKYEHTKVFSCI